MRQSQLARLIPMPTDAERAEARARAEMTRQREQQRQAECVAYQARMRGRALDVLGHDGRALYVRIKRGAKSRVYQVRLLGYDARPNGRTLRFYGFAFQQGTKPAGIMGFSL